ncbi:MAG: NAD(P)-binding protein [Desulfosarcinaceae bacterium]|jgi:2-polyprenyl-6-methoxyphenol hydroxylase-like FAD-dependent oxidoreductase
MPETKKIRILIVGAGIGGMTLAALLKDRPVDVTLVERVQDDSRRLARTMFVKSAPIAHIRDLATKLYSLEGLAASIAKAFDEPI